MPIMKKKSKIIEVGGFNQYSSGVLYTDLESHPTREIIEMALEEVNKASTSYNLQVIYQRYSFQSNDVFESVCASLESGVVGLIASGTSNNVKLIAELATNFHIPSISPSATNPFIQETETTEYLLNLMPSDYEQCKAIFALIKHHKWKEFSILTSADDYGINGMLKLQSLALTHGYKVHNNQQFVVPVDHHGAHALLDVTTELQVIKHSLSKIIVLICDGWYSPYIFKQALDLGLMTQEYAWIVTDGIATQPIVLEQDGVIPVYLNGLLGTRPTISLTSPQYQALHHKFVTRFPDRRFELGGYVLTLYDTIKVFAEGLDLLIQENNHQPIETEGFFCHQSYVEGRYQHWKYGDKFLRALKRVNLDTGMTGHIQFDKVGWPRNVVYDILNIQNQNFVRIGTWELDTNELILPYKAIYFDHSDTAPTSKPNTLKGSKFVCGILPLKPFIMETSGPCEGKSCYTGYMIDLMERLKTDLQFEYEFVQPHDRKWGSYNSTELEWTGLVRQLTYNEIDIAAVPLSVNSDREHIIDFSFPFMDSSNTAVLKASKSTQNNFFFLLPFENTVWYSVIVMNIIVTFFFYFANKTSPYGRSASYVHALMSCTCRKCTRRRLEQVDLPEDSTEMKRQQSRRCLFNKGFAKDSRNGTNFYNSVWIVSTGLFGKTRGDSPDSLSGKIWIQKSM